MALNDRQRRFVIEYVIDSNGTQAAIRAGYSPNCAAQTAFDLLILPHISEAIEIRQREIASAAALTCEWVLNEWRQIASADPTELIRTVVYCCRHCYGIDHHYQWTEWEYSRAYELACTHVCGKNCTQPCKIKAVPEAAGGFGYDPHLEPARDCPHCFGHGYEETRVSDMRRVSGPARRLIAGVKKTKDGIEIKMRDQGEALKNIAQYLKMLVNQSEVSGPGGGPIPIAQNITADDLTDDQLAQIAARGLLPAPGIGVE